MTQEIAALWEFPLRTGPSQHPRDGTCLLDAVSWFEYGCLGDHPPCACPILAEYGRWLNDTLDDDDRQGLRAYIPRLVGTVDDSPRVMRTRAYALAYGVLTRILPLELRRHHLGTYEGALVRAQTIEAARPVLIDLAKRSPRPLFRTALDCTDLRSPMTMVTGAGDVLSHCGHALFSEPKGAFVTRALALFDGALAIGRQAAPIYPERVRASVRAFREVAGVP